MHKLRADPVTASSLTTAIKAHRAHHPPINAPASLIPCSPAVIKTLYQAQIILLHVDQLQRDHGANPERTHHQSLQLHFKNVRIDAATIFGARESFATDCTASQARYLIRSLCLRFMTLYSSAQKGTQICLSKRTMHRD